MICTGASQTVRLDYNGLIEMFFFFLKLNRVVYMGFRSSEFPMIPSDGRHLVCQGIYMTSTVLTELYRRSRYTDEPNSRNVIKSVRFLGHASSPRDRAGPIMLGDLPQATGLILGGT